MAKDRPRKPPVVAPKSEGAHLGALLMTLALVAGLAAVLFVTLVQPAAAPPPPPSDKAGDRKPATRRPGKPLKTMGSAKAMAGFSAEHNASLLWGTYRPGVYFGLRSLTYPTALTAGLMWMAADAPSTATMRHKCEQDEVDRYGFSAHDGRGFGVQPIVDGANGVALTTSFLANGGGWSVRLEGAKSEGAKGAGGAKGPGGGGRQSVFFYLAVDAEYADASSQAAAAGGFDRGPPLGSERGAAAAHVAGAVRGLGDVSVVVEAREQGGGSGGGGGGAEVRVWGSSDPGHSHLNAGELVRSQLDAQLAAEAEARARQGGKAARQPAPPKVPDRVEPGSKLVVVQAWAAAMRSRRVWNRREWPPRVAAV